jgi:hypothetical protein
MVIRARHRNLTRQPDDPRPLQPRQPVPPTVDPVERTGPTGYVARPAPRPSATSTDRLAGQLDRIERDVLELRGDVLDLMQFMMTVARKLFDIETEPG